MWGNLASTGGIKYISWKEIEETIGQELRPRIMMDNVALDVALWGCGYQPIGRSDLR